MTVSNPSPPCPPRSSNPGSCSRLLRRRRLRLFCFPYAGDSVVSFLPWKSGVDPDIEICTVQLPSRVQRRFESQSASMQTFMKHHLCVAVARHSDLPFAFFGHRLAALLAFEVARACQRGALPMSRYLFVSGCGVARDHQPPGIPLGQDDDALISMKELSGVPDEFLEDRVVIATLLPTIQADPTMTLDYRYSDAAPLEIPMTVLAGSQNTHVDLARLDDWHLEANASCVVRRPLGSHFFIHSSRLALLDCLNRMLRDVC